MGNAVVSFTVTGVTEDQVSGANSTLKGEIVALIGGVSGATLASYGIQYSSAFG